MTTAREDLEFLKAVINSTLLEDAISWISSNLDPEEVFSEAQLRQWAGDIGLEESDA